MKNTKESKTEIPPYEPDAIEKDLYTLFSPEWLEQTAKETGLMNYEKFSNKKLSDSSWYDRFTPELVAFLKLCVTHGIEQLAKEQTKVLNEKIAKFQDVLIQDSTIKQRK